MADAVVELAYARPPRRRRTVRPRVRRRLLRGERLLRWGAFGLMMFGFSQYAASVNSPAFVVTLFGLLLALLWGPWLLVTLLFLVPFGKLYRRTLLLRAVVAVAMSAIFYSARQTQWPLHANFALSRPFLDAAADRVERGESPGFCGGFFFVHAERHGPHTVGLYTGYARFGGWSGLVRHPVAGRRLDLRLGNFRPVPLGPRWETVAED